MEEKQLTSLEFQEQITYLERMKHQRQRDNLMAKSKLETEVATSKFWSQLGKQKKSHDAILELRIPDSNPPKYESRSDKMAELAKDYHNNLQTQFLTPKEIKETKMNEVLTFINTRLEELQKDNLEEQLAEQDIQDIIKQLPNGKATGTDGIPYEFWKLLSDEYHKDKAKGETQETTFNVAKMLTTVFNDIERHGLTVGTHFPEGWMCPIYKKKDRTDIANYRPLTMLNSDYKIFAKGLTTKLAQTAPSIIHENQAGFVPGRSISDQVRLTQTILDYAITEEQNGAIIALDQEKAYDKITHDYLWLVLEKYGFPQQFIKTV